jgi:hypothetical protein
MEFKNGFLTLPGGMKYRLLVLPDSPTMTPELLKKIKSLVDAGALVIGPKPGKSPSLSGYPHCDGEVQKLSAELWDSGKILSGTTAAEALAARGLRPDFDCDQPQVRWIHRSTDDLEVYFVANGAAAGKYPYAGWPLVANCSFRIADCEAEFWDPETGRMAPAVIRETSGGVTRIPIVLPPKGSVFVVFHRRPSASPGPTVRSISQNGKALLAVDGRQSPPPPIAILSASYGKPGEPEHLRDVKAMIQNLVNNGELTFPVVKLAALGGDPDLNVVKTLDIHYRIQDKEEHLLLHDGDTVDFNAGGEAPPATVEAGPNGDLQVCVTEPGDYSCVFSSGKTAAIEIPAVPEPLPIPGPWTVVFPGDWGAPAEIQMEQLIPWNQHSDAGVRYFSGTASYRCEFQVPAELLVAGHRLELDLGEVGVMARVTLNGGPARILWKTPFRLEATPLLRAGPNTLEIAVANLWVNRLIGDQQLPPDAERNPDGSLKNWPQWLLAGQRSPTGRFTFTTWELWRKTDPLIVSGLIGPVQLRTVVCRPISYPT